MPERSIAGIAGLFSKEWQNTLFGELILKLIDDGKLELLRKIQKNEQGAPMPRVSSEA